MPLFSEHIANMYYGSSSPYTGSPYSYSSSLSPIGSSYSAPYLHPGGSYSNHSSLGGYSRAPVTSRWITSSGRNYAPMLSTIAERGSASPVRINSPRRIPLSTRSYGTASYTPRPVNINTADIDVSRDKYRHKIEPPPIVKQQENSSDKNSENSPFMPRVDGKPETGIDSSPGKEHGTIKRGRTVVRLYTIKRKERDSPRKPIEEKNVADNIIKQNIIDDINESSKKDEKEFLKWREKLSDDLTYKEKKEKKSLGAKLVEKFILKDDKDPETTQKNKLNHETVPITTTNITSNTCSERRCSMELLAEQANLLDSLIRSENLSTATLDLSKIGVVEDNENSKTSNLINPLKTTKSDHSLHDSLTSFKNVRDIKNYSKRRSIKKSSSGSNVRRLDSITELPKEPNNENNDKKLEINETTQLIIQKRTNQKSKPKLKHKITGTVEVSVPVSPLKFIVENVTVEEKVHIPKKEITYSSKVEEAHNTNSSVTKEVKSIDKEQLSDMTVTNIVDTESQLSSPEPESGNFWDKIGKRETIYLMKRKQNIDEEKEKHKRALFWFPEETESDNLENSASNNRIDLITMDTNNDTINCDNEKDKTGLMDIEGFKDATNKILHTEIMSSNTDIMKNNSLLTQTTYEPSNTVNSDLNEIKHQTAPTDSKKVSHKKMGKRGSLENISQNKSKLESQKKTKSEKLNKDHLVHIKQFQPLVTKSNVTATSSDKINTQHISQDVIKISAALKCENNEKVKNIVNVKQDVITDQPDKINPSCPIHGSERRKESKVESKIGETEIVLKTVSDNQELTDNLDKLIICSVPPLDAKIIKEKSVLKEKNVVQKDSKNLNSENMNETTNKNETISTNSCLANDISTISDVMCKIDVAKEVKSSNMMINNFSSVHLKDVILEDERELPKSNKSVSKHTIIESNGEEILANENVHAKSLRITETSIQEIEVSNLNKGSMRCDDTLKDNLTESNTNQNSKTDKKPNSFDIPLIPESISVLLPQKSTDVGSLIDSSANKEIKILDVADNLKLTEPQDIPKDELKIQTQIKEQSDEKTEEINKAETTTQLDQQQKKLEDVSSLPAELTRKRPVKEEKALRPLIATPRPLQKKAPQIIHSSDSSDSSSEESSEEDDDSDSSEASGEFYECENNPDGRTSTGSNDSGFDSSAPTSPATFSQIKKDCDVNCHRKCEKLTANLCGVNQRLLVEALASRTASKKGGEATATCSNATNSQNNNTDILEQDLEQSTAYDIFRKTGRFTPPARSIPRFRKYTVEDFQFIKVLGKGSFGKVLLAELRDTEYYYAVKCLKKDVVLEDDDVECTLIERKVLALGTNHPYLCHLFATFQTDSHLFFVMEYLNGGDLMFHIQQSGRFPEARARFYAAEIVSGLKFLHKRGIVYRDLKLDNILLDFEGHVRIADFGMCKLQIYLDKTADTFCGTPDYMAPEIIKGLKYNQTVDWWSFGVLLYEMLIGQSPFSGCDEDELFWSICNEMPSYPRFLSHEALTILTRLLDKDARTRLGGTECMHGDIREQEFFHAIHWDRLERRELETPFRPRVRHPMDTQYFDRAFTGERPRLTAVEPHVLRSMDQEPFRGFSYTNPNTTDR